jgi:hypothetical protein
MNASDGHRPPLHFQIPDMSADDLDLPDLSGHPPPPEMTLGQYEKWVFEMYAKSKYPTMSHEEMLKEWMRNEGSQTEEWPDFGA